MEPRRSLPIFVAYPLRFCVFVVLLLLSCSVSQAEMISISIAGLPPAQQPFGIQQNTVPLIRSTTGLTIPIRLSSTTTIFEIPKGTKVLAVEDEDEMSKVIAVADDDSLHEEIREGGIKLTLQTGSSSRELTLTIQGHGFYSYKEATVRLIFLRKAFRQSVLTARNVPFTIDFSMPSEETGIQEWTRIILAGTGLAALILSFLIRDAHMGLLSIMRIAVLQRSLECTNELGYVLNPMQVSVGKGAAGTYYGTIMTGFALIILISVLHPLILRRIPHLIPYFPGDYWLLAIGLLCPISIACMQTLFLTDEPMRWTLALIILGLFYIAFIAFGYLSTDKRNVLFDHKSLQWYHKYDPTFISRWSAFYGPYKPKRRIAFVVEIFVTVMLCALSSSAPSERGPQGCKVKAFGSTSLLFLETIFLIVARPFCHAINLRVILLYRVAEMVVGGTAVAATLGDEPNGLVVFVGQVAVFVGSSIPLLKYLGVGLMTISGHRALPDRTVTVTRMSIEGQDENEEMRERKPSTAPGGVPASAVRVPPATVQPRMGPKGRGMSLPPGGGEVIPSPKARGVSLPPGGGLGGGQAAGSVMLVPNGTRPPPGPTGNTPVAPNVKRQLDFNATPPAGVRVKKQSVPPPAAAVQQPLPKSLVPAKETVKATTSHTTEAPTVFNLRGSAQESTAVPVKPLPKAAAYSGGTDMDELFRQAELDTVMDNATVARTRSQSVRKEITMDDIERDLVAMDEASAKKKKRTTTQNQPAPGDAPLGSRSGTAVVDILADLKEKDDDEAQGRENPLVEKEEESGAEDGGLAFQTSMYQGGFNQEDDLLLHEGSASQNHTVAADQLATTTANLLLDQDVEHFTLEGIPMQETMIVESDPSRDTAVGAVGGDGGLNQPLLVSSGPYSEIAPQSSIIINGGKTYEPVTNTEVDGFGLLGHSKSQEQATSDALLAQLALGDKSPPRTVHTGKSFSSAMRVPFRRKPGPVAPAEAEALKGKRSFVYHQDTDQDDAVFPDEFHEL